MTIEKFEKHDIGLHLINLKAILCYIKASVCDSFRIVSEIFIVISFFTDTKNSRVFPML